MKQFAASESVDMFKRDEHEWDVCATREQDKQPRTANILYAEGDLGLRRAATQTLTRTGYRVTSAEDGLHAWKRFTRANMTCSSPTPETPRMSGLELAAMARFEGMKLPIIVACDSFGSRTYPSAPSSAWPPPFRSPFHRVN
jgi:hypothetical protein